EIEMKEYAGNPYISAKNFKVGEKISLKVISYDGFQEFVASDGSATKSSPTYTVDLDGSLYKFRLNKRNTSILMGLGVKNWEELVGKTLAIQIFPTAKGNSLQVIDLK
ncbi:MAG: hypothetical protein QW478_14225, partial [Candidatus Micrarchaeaceae archaeon]